MMAWLAALGPKGKLALKIAGFVTLGLVSLVMFLQLTFPYDRVRDKLVEALAGSYDVSVRKVSRGFLPGKMILEGVMLRSRSAVAAAGEDAPPPMILDRVEVDVGVMALITGGFKDISIDLEAAIGRGRLAGNVIVPLGRRGVQRFDLTWRGIEAADAPVIKDFLGLPMEGPLDGKVVLALSPAGWKETTGTIAFSCAGACVLGDGKTKFKPQVTNTRSAAMVGDGIDLGRVMIDRLSTRLEIKDGELNMTEWDFASPDGQLQLSLQLRLARQFKDSEVINGCVRFKADPTLEKREPKTYAALQTTGAVIGPDQLFHIKLEGKFKRRPRVCGDGASGGDGEDATPGGRRAKPTLGAIEPPDPATAPTPMPAGNGATVNPPDDVFIKDESKAAAPPPPTPIDAAPPPPPTPSDAAPPPPPPVEAVVAPAVPDEAPPPTPAPEVE